MQGTTLCPSCTLSSAMRDCTACHAWTRAIRLYIPPLKPVQVTGNEIKAIHEQRHGMKYDHFELADGRKVGILLYVNPEEF